MKAAASAAPRPPRAVVGSQISFEEEMFGAAFDGRVVRRFWSFVVPYRRRLGIGVVAVLAFTLTQIAIPLVLRYAIDDALAAGSAGLEVLHSIVIAFFAVVGLNYASNFTQEFIVGRISGSLLFDLRRAMYRHLQHVSLSFMDKTEGGPAHVPAPGRRQRASGVPRDLHLRDRRLRPPHRHRHRPAVPRSAPRSAHPLGGAGADRGARRLAATRQAGIPAGAGDEFGGSTGRLRRMCTAFAPIQEMGREAVNFDLFDGKAKDNLLAHLRASKFSNAMIPIVDTLTGIAMAIVILAGGGMVLGRRSSSG